MEAAMPQYLALVQEHKEFIPRGLAENDPAYKQIIPYIIFTHDDRYFLMQRQQKATEQRLASNFTLGIGGHLRQEDLQGTDIIAWAQREFHEEIAYDGNLTMEPLGILNDDSNAVGQVHVGMVLLARGEHGNIAVRSELQHGTLQSLAHCKAQYATMETWSKIVLDYLSSRHSRTT